MLWESRTVRWRCSLCCTDCSPRSCNLRLCHSVLTPRIVLASAPPATLLGTPMNDRSAPLPPRRIELVSAPLVTLPLCIGLVPARQVLHFHVSPCLENKTLCWNSIAFVTYCIKEESSPHVPRRQCQCFR